MVKGSKGGGGRGKGGIKKALASHQVGVGISSKASSSLGGVSGYQFYHLLQTLKVLIRLKSATNKFTSGVGLPLFLLLLPSPATPPCPAQRLQCFPVASVELVCIYVCVGCRVNLCVQLGLVEGMRNLKSDSVRILNTASPGLSLKS